MIRSILILLSLAGGLWAVEKPDLKMDADSDWVYHPLQTRTAGRHPLLIILSCNGGVKQDLDTTRALADSLGWITATPFGSRNHRSPEANNDDIMKLARKCLADPRVDPRRVYIFGFSGAGVQALSTAFANPMVFTGVIATCGHDAGLVLQAVRQAPHLAVFLTTREEDWNRQKNEYMRDLFTQNGNPVSLTMTPGTHGPGPKSEMMAGCRWLDKLFKK